MVNKILRNIKMHKTIYFLIIIFSSTFFSTSHADEKEILTLYRNSTINSEMRIHIATFNSKDGYAYNSENCLLAAKLFQSQPGVKTRFWCEKGNFKD